MNPLGRPPFTAAILVWSCLACPRSASAQDLTVHGTTTSMGSAYLATTTGNVGIGTTAPQFRLQIVDTYGNNGTLALGAIGVVQSPLEAASEFDRLLVGQGLAWDHGASRFTLTNPLYDRSALVFMNGGNIGFFSHAGDRTSNPTMTRTELAGYQRMVITNTGRVGVGTPTPGFSLHVVDPYGNNGTLALGAFGVGIVQNQIDSGNGFDRLLVGEGIAWDHDSARYTLTNPAYDRSAIVFMNGGGIGFFSHAGDRTSNPTMTRTELAGYQRMVVTATGSVGIGTATPAYRLHVNGPVGASAYFQASSREFKQDIEHLDGAELERMRAEVRKLGVARYRYRAEVGGGDVDEHLGFIAEEMPPDVLAQDGKAVDLYELTAYAIGAMKALDAQAQRLQAEVDSQRGQIDALRAELARLR